MDLRFYVYGHYRNDTGELFYIGKGTGHRLNTRIGRSKPWHLIADNVGFTSKILEGNLSSDDALTKEKELIIGLGDSLINNRIPELVTKYCFQEISNLFYYDPSSPSGLRWKTDRENSLGRLCKYKDKVAGSKTHKYWIVEHKNKSYVVHRIIYFLFNPDMNFNLDLDHIDGDGFNNSLNNLRLVEKPTNVKNRILPSVTGHSYVYFLEKSGGKRGRPLYMLKIPLDGKRKEFYFYLHEYEDKESALKACLHFKDKMKDAMLCSGITERAFYGKN